MKVTTITTVDRSGVPQVTVQTEPCPMTDAMIDARATEHQAMLDPANWHPLIGSRFWRLTDEELAEALANAEVAGEIEHAVGHTLVYGYLGKSRGYEPFFCLRDDASARHVMVCPGMLN